MPDVTSTATANLRRGVGVSTLSIAWTIVASTLAIGAGVRASSLVLVAFGCTGLLDAAGSIALVVHFRHALKHERFSDRHERVALLIVTLGLVLVALGTSIQSVARLMTQAHGEQTLTGIGVASASVLVLALLARSKMTLGRAIPSQAMFADGLLSTTGAVLALVTVLGTLLTALGLWWGDPVAALVVAMGALAVALILTRQ